MFLNLNFLLLWFENNLKVNSAQYTKGFAIQFAILWVLNQVHRTRIRPENIFLINFITKTNHILYIICNEMKLNIMLYCNYYWNSKNILFFLEELMVILFEINTVRPMQSMEGLFIRISNTTKIIHSILENKSIENLIKFLLKLLFSFSLLNYTSYRKKKKTINRVNVWQRAKYIKCNLQIFIR